MSQAGRVLKTPGARRPVFWVGLAAAVLLSAVGLAWQPWLYFGVLLGGSLMAATVRWPLVVVAVMLALGPLDLSFLTGGFKGLFEEIGGLDMNGIRLVFVSTGFGLLLASDRRHWVQFTWPAVRWYLLFLLYAAVTVAYSQDPMEGLRLLLKLTWPLLIFLVVSRPGRTWRDVEGLVDWMLVGAAVLIVVNPLFILRGDVIVEVSGDVRLMGAGAHQNPFSFAMLAVVLVALGRFASRGELRYLVLTGGALVWIALTLTRITFLAGVTSLGAVALYAALARRNYRAALGGLAASALILAVLYDPMMTRTFGTAPGAMELWALLQDPVALYESINLSGRQVFWAVLALAWAGSPWVGLGLGSSSGILKSLFAREEGWVAHNEYLRLGTDTGLLGIALFTAAMAAWVRVAARAGRSPDPRAQEVALPALALLMAWAVISLTDNAFDYYAPFTQFVGFLVGASVVAGGEGAASGGPAGAPPTDPT
jgi:O-antigen ligase